MRGTTSSAYTILIVFFCYTVSGSGNSTDTCNAANGNGAWMEDGACDPQNSIPECDWDGGDCCRCTCVDNDFFCGTDGYFCVNPDVFNNNLITCEDVTLSLCPEDIQTNWVVENTTQVQILAEAINCSGGTFEVEWIGSIVVDTEIVVTSGCVLNISGSVGSSAVLDGGGNTRLFRVVNASLQLNDVEVRNGSATFGGAIAAIKSTVILNRTSLIGNTATTKNGGAMFIYGRSKVSFSGKTDFINNTSVYDGGALYVVNSSVSWDSVSNFSRNNAAHSGGALCAVVGSTVSWDAETTFIDNSAGSYNGGALSLEGGSNASWSGDASFSHNSAQYEGGAIYVDHGSNVFWSGGAFFFGNTATFGGGGAIFIVDASTVTLNGETAFTSNACGQGGGAISSTPLNSYIEKSSLFVNGSVTFSNNKCGSTGGGLALLGGLAVSFEGSNTTFRNNSAGVAGGAVSISATDEGPTFFNVSFLSNYANVGGGVYITGSSTSSVDEKLSATFDECTFTGNKAEVTGGAIEVATGTAALTNTSFKSNVAGLGGGALRLASASYLSGCIFEENLSDVDGSPAIMMTGYYSDMRDCSFLKNGFDCDAGTYIDESTEGDRFSLVCSQCYDCETCTVDRPDNIPTCLTAIEHSNSSGGNLVTLETLSIEEGYWRSTNISTTVLACYNSHACAGGVTGSLDYCSDGYKGPYCAVCSKEYWKGSSFICTKCSYNGWRKAAAAVATVIATIIAFATAKYMVLVGEERTRGWITTRLIRLVPLHSVKMIIVTWQILTQFAAVANITYPGIYQRFLNIVDVLNFDPSWMLAAGCVADVDFHGRFLIMTMGPILIILLLKGTYLYVVRRHDATEETIQIAQHKHVSAVLFIMFLVYSCTSSMVFQMFNCDALDDGHIYLRADYTIHCDGLRHRALLIYAGFMILVYPLGIPSVFAVLLYRNRGILLDKVARDNVLSARSISDLWKPYKPSRLYYEVFECGRRIVLMSVVMVVDDDSAAKIAVSLTLAIVFTVTSEALAPYESQFDAWVNRLGHAVVVFSIYFALLLKVDISNDSQNSQRMFEVILVLVHVLMILTAIAEMALTGCSLTQRQMEDPWPRYRGYRSELFRTRSRSLVRISPVREIELVGG